MTNGTNGGDPHESSRPAPSRVLISATCMTHGGAVNFTNVVITKINGEIELDPHAVRACVIRFDEDGATALRDTLMAWLG